MFIELTEKAKRRTFLINVNSIELICEKDGENHVALQKSISIITEESYEEVKALIEQEVQAERGYQYELTTIIRNTKETRRKNCERERFRRCRSTR